MFGKSKILKNGERANAAVVDSDMSGLSNSHGAHKWHLKLKVQFDDGTTADVSCSAYEVRIGIGYGPGDIIPVRYDPKDRSTVVVDTVALQAASTARREEGRAKLAQMAEEKLSRGEGPSLE